MCKDCGCEIGNKLARQKTPGTLASPSQITSFKKISPSAEHRPQKIDQHGEHGGGEARKIALETAVLAKNNLIAAANRQWFQNHQIPVLNLISSPGSGKTLLLEATVKLIKDQFKLAILAGDQERDFDALRLSKAGAEVKQINTIASCHLDSAMIERQLGNFVKPDLDMLVIENVGNLVCPAAFDLGESEKVALLATTEGEDKPAKYPLIFAEADLVVITKMDLVPHLDWSLDHCIEHILSVNPRARIIQLSAKTGQGMGEWTDYLKEKISQAKHA